MKLFAVKTAMKKQQGLLWWQNFFLLNDKIKKSGSYWLYQLPSISNP
jgi:hypothetical protein